jgi:AraC-like DNA-binding protein
VHDDYVIGVMTAGPERLVTGGSEYLASPGDLILIEPGKAHSNASLPGRKLGYRVFYIPEPLMVAAAGTPIRFGRAVVAGGRLAQRLLRIHSSLADCANVLEQETAFYLALAALAGRECAIGGVRVGRSHRQANMAREFLDARFREEVSLRQLANTVGLSPFHLLRCFAAETGLTPRAYQTQRRIREARHLLRMGVPIADVAASVGFADQSHMTRHFQRIVGTSPGRYAQQ